MKWRIIPLEVNDAFMNMAIDEALGESVASGAPPTIRFYRWDPSAVSIGYFQSLLEEVDVDECERLGVDIVRRRTGGGAVYHDFDGEITYSLVAPQELYGTDILDSYRVICGHVIESLETLGLPAEFSPVNDVLVNGKKISGNAQTRRGGVLLQHGTLLFRVDPDIMFRLLRVGEEKLKDKYVRSVKDRVTSVTDELGQIPMEDLHAALRQGFARGKKWRSGTLDKGEKARAEAIAGERYGTREWNFSR
jgi:lipoate-protein ligase A